MKYLSRILHRNDYMKVYLFIDDEGFYFICFKINFYFRLIIFLHLLLNKYFIHSKPVDNLHVLRKKEILKIQLSRFN